jgi:hypothetical protein
MRRERSERGGRGDRRDRPERGDRGDSGERRGREPREARSDSRGEGGGESRRGRSSSWGAGKPEGRGGRFSGNGRGNGGRGRSGYGRRRPSPHDSGNQRERIAVESGSLVLIDQFMLANPEFLSAYSEIIDSPLEDKNALIERFGGVVVDIGPGTYRIARDPFKLTIIVHPEGEVCNAEDFQDGELEGHTLFVDTRCIVMVDRELLDDSGLLEKYNQLWFSGQDKACRDLLRDNGGAVRYGFSRNSDDLKVVTHPETAAIGIWPASQAL